MRHVKLSLLLHSGAHIGIKSNTEYGVVNIVALNSYIKMHFFSAVIDSLHVKLWNE